MSDSMLALQRKISSADDLRSVVRTMKAMAAASISQYEKAILSLDDYYRTVELGLIACLRSQQSRDTNADVKTMKMMRRAKKASVGVIIFGSDQGLVGRFNDTLLAFMKQTLDKHVAHALFWPVGERMQSHLIEHTFNCARSFRLPRSIDSITSLVTALLLEIEALRQIGQVEEIYIYFNRPMSNAEYEPVAQRLLPLDLEWQHALATSEWPGNAIPQLIDGLPQTFSNAIHEYLFVSLFRACTASLASENTSRLTAMQRAEKNIEELREQFYRLYHQQRQHKVDEELFDLVGGFEALKQN